MVTLITDPITREIIIPSTKNPGWGTVRLVSEQTIFENGTICKEKRYAFIRGEIKNLEQVFKKEGQTFPGKIIYKQSFEPLYEGQKLKKNTTTNEYALKDGRMFYVDSFYTEEPNATDFWVTTTIEPTKTLRTSTKLITIDKFIGITGIAVYLLMSIYYSINDDSTEFLEGLSRMYYTIIDWIKTILILVGAIAIIVVYFKTNKFKDF